MLQRLERYYDEVPRSAARAESIGPFTLFVREGGGFPYYARPSLGAARFTRGQVDAVRQRQRELDAPESFEWVAETTSALRKPIEASGLAVHGHPLLVLEQLHYVQPVEGISIRLVTPQDDIARIRAVARVAFGSEGPDSKEAVERDRERIRARRTVTAAAFTSEGVPVGVGSHQPVDDVSEIVGVATLPAHRRRGIAGALTAALVRDALEKVSTVFLSAGDDDVARVYERVGFRRVATACIAEP